MKDDSTFLRYIVKDETYASYSVHELKTLRANMVNSGAIDRYEFALVQYTLMNKENRLNDLAGQQN
ncbi:hypothetical protein LCGC14_2915630 [marine sediment metagenome]|uniref:Uncharacterized protein n=1 Tax=marine sediment metagenome TaxID=412755 RepID=A0A0F8ZXY3_9ZZZZ